MLAALALVAGCKKAPAPPRLAVIPGASQPVFDDTTDRITLSGRSLVVWQDNPHPWDYYHSDAINAALVKVTQETLKSPEIAAAWIQSPDDRLVIAWFARDPVKVSFDLLDAQGKTLQNVTISDQDHTANSSQDNRTIIWQSQFQQVPTSAVSLKITGSNSQATPIPIARFPISAPASTDTQSVAQ